MLAEPTFDDELVTPHQLLSIMATIQGCVVPDPTLRHSNIWTYGHGGQKESSILEFLHTRNASHGVNPHSNSSSDKSPTVLLDLLRALPFRIAEVIGRPESAEDIFATLSAITTVTACCDISFACNETGAA